MKSTAKTVEEYIQELPEKRKNTFVNIRETIQKNIPKGFEETLSYGMLGYVVPHSLYPQGYHCDPQLPLPFIHLANQKNGIHLYHMGIYADTNLLDWFVSQYPKHVPGKLNMGKSCIRFQKMEEVPYALIGELVQKISVQKWIEIYETAQKK